MRTRRRAGCRTAIVLLALASACAPGRRAPNVVVVLVDTLRADRLGSYGDGRGLTPFLDGLATRGVRFANAYAASSWTSPSVASLFTSRYPSQHRIADFDSALAAEEVTLAERLRDAGWQTFGISANFRLLPALGFAQGFDDWFLFTFRREPTADYLGRRVARWLDRPRRRLARVLRPRPLLLYVHCMEPHGPYEPPARFRRGPAATATDAARAAVNARLASLAWDGLGDDDVALLAALYDGEVAAVDARLRGVFAMLEARGVLDGALVVVTADHGEELREHGLLGHGYQLHEESVRVPLLLLGPGVPAGRVVDTPVSLVDVAPTVLALAGVAAEPRFEGRSLEPLFAGGDAPPRDVLAELLAPRAGTIPTRDRAALVRGRTKLLVHREGTAALYDLVADPGETRPDPPSLASQAPALRAALGTLTDTLARRAGPGASAPVDAEMRERLRGLGYAN